MFEVHMILYKFFPTQVMAWAKIAKKQEGNKSSIHLLEMTERNRQISDQNQSDSD